jgi:hypothetical protein
MRIVVGRGGQEGACSIAQCHHSRSRNESPLLLAPFLLLVLLAATFPETVAALARSVAIALVCHDNNSNLAIRRQGTTWQC